MSDLDQHRRRHLIIGGSSALLLILVVACVAAVIYNSSDEDVQNSPRITANNVHAATKSVEMLCSSTDYRNTCQSSLSKAVKSDNPDPQDLIKAAVSVLFDEIGTALNKTRFIKTNDTHIKGAIEDCNELFLNSKDELHSSLDAIVDKGIDHLPDRAHDIRNWLSAVMSYQQTCIDGFPEGVIKDKLEDEMTVAKELTSNALAIVGKAANFFSMLNIDGVTVQRKLLVKEEETDGSDDFLTWESELGDRRTLKEGSNIKLKPNATVAKDGSGQFKTISAALAAMPKKYKGRYVIHVKPGVYQETVMVERKMENVTIYGDDPSKTIVTGKKNFVDGTRTFQTATFAAIGDGFMALRITFRNTAGAIKHQAVALRVQSDRSVFLFCHMEGYQDTLYAQTHRQFYHGCVISGTIDFIFGDAAAIFQNCIMVVRRPLDNQQNIVTAQGRADRHETTGFVLQQCRIVPDTTLKPEVKRFRSYLGRPWKEYSKIVIMESEIDGLISPDGYMPWEKDFGLKTLYYAEYQNKGKGSKVKARVKWPGVEVLEKKEADYYTVAKFLQGGDWINMKATGVHVPVKMGLYN